VQLRNRREERPTLDVNDEYDVQDLVHVLLRLYFDDVHPEEWVPSYAGSASRTDFLLPAVDNVIEVKKTRQGLNAKVIGERLIIDIARYKQHPQCRRLICFVYDPEGRITNPAGIESDLNRDARRSRPFSLVRWAAVEPRQSESATKGYPAVEEWMRYEDLGHG
jgi:hypothetical protein